MLTARIGGKTQRERGARWLFGIAALLSLGGCRSLPQGAAIADEDEPKEMPSLPILKDDRAAIRAATRPPAISGGTLLALRSRGRVSVSDPDRSRIVVANIDAMRVEATLELEPFTEPGRAVEDGAGRLHVVLRGAGEIASFDPASPRALERRHVCETPRGIAYVAANDSLIVACEQGKLAEIPASGGAPVRVTAVDVDVRDVIASGEKLTLTRFRSAEVLDLDATRSVVNRRVLPSVLGVLSGIEEQVPFDASVAWRAVVEKDGSLVIAHQRGTRESIGVGGKHPSPDQPIADSPYAGSDLSGCGGVVHSAITILRPNGTTTTRELEGMTLPVDVATAADGSVAVAAAGVHDRFGAAPRRSLSVAVYRRASLESGVSGQPCVSPDVLEDAAASAVIGVAFDAGGRLVAQTREPATLRIYDLPQATQPPLLGGPRVLSLGGASAFDTGHELFHRDVGGGLACASCHPEGTEDGRVWKFSDVGLRRTQSLEVGIGPTAPYHWDGSLPDMVELTSEILTRRMRGPEESAERVQALADYVFGFSPRPPLRAADDAAVLRGKSLFESPGAGCIACHHGEKLGSNSNVDVGKGSSTQVPSLLAVGYRAPFMHDGCALTLRDRFDPLCGGSAHGATSNLDEPAILDLVAYLESL